MVASSITTELNNLEAVGPRVPQRFQRTCWVGVQGFCATRSQGVVGEQPGASGRAWECGAGSGARVRGGAQGYVQQLPVSEMSEWT